MSDSTAFSSLPIPASQLANLETLGYTAMTPIQAQALPLILQGRDLIGQARTGSGKTVAFGIGLVNRINPRFFGVQALVLCPTRELADQVGKELRLLARAVGNIKLVLLCGGKPLGPQKHSLEHGAHIAVGTPGRILDHISKGSLTLDQLKVLVLDEADRMLDMGFAEAMEQIIAATPRSRQTLLFSATYPESIKKICRSVQRNPASVTVESEHTDGAIEQLFYQTDKHQRDRTLLQLFQHYRPASALVFCHTKKQCDEVAAYLNDHRVQALAIHGDFDQRMRDQVLARFANGSCPVLVATDVASRGLDIKSLPAVINYELPRDPEVYVHRVGRTGRAGEHGIALSIYAQHEQGRLNAIEAFTGRSCICDVPESLDPARDYSLIASMATIEIAGGRKHKIRPGDILGALTGDAGLPGSAIGKIDIFDMVSYVAVEEAKIRQALNYLANGKIKGKTVRARKVR